MFHNMPLSVGKDPQKVAKPIQQSQRSGNFPLLGFQHAKDLKSLQFIFPSSPLTACELAARPGTNMLLHCRFTLIIGAKS